MKFPFPIKVIKDHPGEQKFQTCAVHVGMKFKSKKYFSGVYDIILTGSRAIFRTPNPLPDPSQLAGVKGVLNWNFTLNYDGERVSAWSSVVQFRIHGE